MPDIEKLKQEAEEARKRAAELIMYAQMPIADVSTHSKVVQIVDALTLAAAKQIALQAAEKEAEARKYDPLVYRNDDGVWAAKSDPAPIADGTWIQHGGNACPIPYARYVQIKRRDGKVESNTASMFYWEWSGKKLAESDPIAYRIISPAADRVSES